jgi:hypothetical protein
MLTNNGRELLMRYLANVSPGFVREIGVGIGNKSVSAEDSRLDFEVARVTVTTGSINGSTNEIVYSGSLAAIDEYTVREIGLFPVSSSAAGVPVRGALLTTFEPGDGSIFQDSTTPPSGQESRYITKSNSVEVPAATGLKIGTSAAYLRQGASVSFPSLGDYSQYGPNDEINLAFGSGVAAYNLLVELFDTEGNSKSITISGTASSESSYFYTIKSSLIGTQTINFANLSQIKITNNGSSYVVLDGIRFEEVDLANPLNSIVARQLVTPSKEKFNGFATDVEYRLTVDWS